MPELQHYATLEEALRILHDVIEKHGLRLVPEDPVLPQPHLDTYERVTPEVEAKLAHYPVVQLEGPYTKHPLQFDQRIAGKAAGTYSLDLMSGPRLRWVFPRVVQEGERPVVVPGSISYLKSYKNLDTNEWEPASEQLKQAFQVVVKTIKEHMVRVPVRKGDTIWVAKDTKQKVDEGTLFIDR